MYNEAELIHMHHQIAEQKAVDYVITVTASVSFKAWWRVTIDKESPGIPL